MTKRRRRSKKWIYWLFFLVLLIGAVLVCSMVYKDYFSDKPEEGAESKVEVKDDEEKEEGEQDTVAGEAEVVKKEEVVQYDGDNPNELEELTGAITYAGANGNKLMIRVNIDQYLTDGVCNLSLRENGALIFSDSVGLDSSASTTTCMGFDIPLSITGGGNFQITINVNGDGKNGTIMGEVNV